MKSDKRESPLKASAKSAASETLRLSERGLPMLLGDLQAKVLRAVWKLQRPASARQIHGKVIRQHQVELLTIITVLNKLVAKGVSEPGGAAGTAAAGNRLTGMGVCGRICGVLAGIVTGILPTAITWAEALKRALEHVAGAGVFYMI